MNLILHIGTNKTGSSALQSHMFINRHELMRDGFWFVESNYDDNMKRGNISPGNGILLSKYLHDLNRKKLFKYLLSLKKEATKKGVGSIILSSEGLIRLFSSFQVISLLYDITEKLGFKKVKCICVLRDPLSHALSLYKHRAKSGKWKNVEEWFNSDFETLKLFADFLVIYSKFQFNWIFLEYSNVSEKLIERFYSNGLGLNLSYNYKTLPIQVNQSLTLNNIKFIQDLTEKYPLRGHFFYSELKDKKYNRIENPIFIEEFNTRAISYFKNHKETLSNMSELVNNSNWLEIIQKVEPRNQQSLDSNVILTENHLTYLNYLSDHLYSSFFKELFLLIRVNLKRSLLGFIALRKFDKKRYGGHIKFK